MKDGNKEYKDENFKRAIEHYSRAVEKEPDYAEAWFYLGSSNQALYRPGKETPENQAYLQKAIRGLQEVAGEQQGRQPEPEEGEGQHPGRADRHLLGGAVQGLPHRRGLLRTRWWPTTPSDPKNLYALANLQEKCNKITEAEGDATRRWRPTRWPPTGSMVPEGQAAPEQPAAARRVAVARVHGARERRGRPGCARSRRTTTSRCGTRRAPSGPRPAARAALAVRPGDRHPAEVHAAQAAGRRRATRRSRPSSGTRPTAIPRSPTSRRRSTRRSGLQAVDKALELKPEYFEAMIYKGHALPREGDCVAKNPRLRDEYLQEAQNQQKRPWSSRSRWTRQAAANRRPWRPPSPRRAK